MDDRKPIADGGPKQRGSSFANEDADPAARHEGRQEIRNQSTVTPDQYPDRTEGTPKRKGSDS